MKIIASTSTSSPAPKPRRLSNKATDILDGPSLDFAFLLGLSVLICMRRLYQDFRLNVSLNPTLGQRQELVSRIHELPGTEWYTARHVRDHFRGRRDTQAKEILRNRGVQLNTQRRVKENAGFLNNKHPLSDRAVHQLRKCTFVGYHNISDRMCMQYGLR